MSVKPSVLITGASTGIGAVYADRFARRGHDLVLVARDIVRMEALADRLRREAGGAAVDVLQADLTDERDLERVERRLREDVRIGVLVNNAGAAANGDFLDQGGDDVSRIIALNVTALTRLTNAVAPRLVAAGEGSIVNLASVVGLAPEIGMTVYGATKAFVLFLTQGLNLELGPRGVYLQAVLPAATRTEIWERSGRDVNALSVVMDVEELVDAALVGFDRREPVTIPPLPDAGQWTAPGGGAHGNAAQFPGKPMPLSVIVPLRDCCCRGRLNMQKTFFAAVFSSAVLWAGAASAGRDPLDAQTLGTIKSHFSEVIALANRHDLAALHGMFWQSPSVLLVAKSAIPSEGNWAGFWGNDSVDQKLHDIAASGPVVLTPDLSRLKVVGLTADVAEVLRTAEHYGVICRTRRHAQAVFVDHRLDQGLERMEDCLRDHPAGAADTCRQGLSGISKWPFPGIFVLFPLSWRWSWRRRRRLRG